MNTFKDHTNTKPKQISWLPLIIVAILFGLLFWVMDQFKDEQFKDEQRFASGACMGSGWLLLLMPAVFLFSLVFPRKLLKKSFKKNKKNGAFRANKSDTQTNQKSSA
jgi:hypothetical protein